MHHNTNPAAQILLSAPAAITKLVIAFTIAAVAGVVTGNQSCFASDQSSPDKQWEYQSSDEGGKSQMVKAGTTQIVLDLGSDCGYGQNPPSGRRAEFHRMIRVARFDL